MSDSDGTEMTSPPDAPSPESIEPSRPEGAQASPTRARAFWEWLRPLIVLLLALTSFRSAVADWNDVPTGSMKPTILEGDRVFVNKVAYDLRVPFTTWRVAEWGDPRRGDIVVLLSPENGRRLIKRVIGVPGDVLALRRNRLYINGEPARYEPLEGEIAGRLRPDQPFRRFLAWEDLGGDRHPVMVTPSLHSPLGDFGPVTVPDGRYFLLGDNRDESRDSRAIGFIPRDLILGEAVGVAFSVDRAIGFPFLRPGRFFDALE
ncbi:MAG TPA: signal peptidase I [Thermoanaerobaculia bacterium]|nr:signal peptidase I [Thermoanaerobaculia bacterium]